MKIDGRKTTTSVPLDNGNTLEISKFCGMYTIKVVDANRLVVAELASLVSKDEAQAVASNYIDAAWSEEIAAHKKWLNENTYRPLYF